MRKGMKREERGAKRDEKREERGARRDEKSEERDEKRDEKAEENDSLEFSSPPAKMRKGMSVESIGSDEPEFVQQTWTPSPSSKQLTLGASLKRLGAEAKIVKVSSPGATKQQSLKDVLVQKVCRVCQRFTS